MRKQTRTYVVVVAVLAVVVGAGAFFVAILIGGGSEQPEPLAAGEVRPDRLNRVASADGRVVVEIPGESLSGPGTLTITADPAGPRADTVLADDGWGIELEGAELRGPATLRFEVGELAEGEPVPTVSSVDDAESGRSPRRVPAEDVVMEGSEAVVTTDHFSSWFVDRWQPVVDTTRTWLAERLDETFSLPRDQAPRCEGEDAARESGLTVSSDGGRRVYWCLGLGDEDALLKAVNARGYGVVAEVTSGFDVERPDRRGLVDTVADLLTSPPTTPGNTTYLLASGHEILLTADGSRTELGVRLTPDPGAYLLGALDYAIDTYLMLVDRASFGRADRSRAQERLLDVLRGQQCLGGLVDMATTELDTVGAAQGFFGDALEAAMACVAVAGEEVELGPVIDGLVQPAMWVMNGVSAVVSGVVAAADIVFDVDGYQIRVTLPTVVTQETVEDLLVPAGTCGDGSSFGWDQVQPIQLVDGRGESFDDDLAGAGVLGTELVGAVDVTGDGADEAVVLLTCTGSPYDRCCAGRTSLLDYVAVLDLSSDVPQLVGGTITPLDVSDPGSEFDQPRYLEDGSVALDGTTVVTRQRLVYPEQLDPADVTALEGEVRYDLVDGRWTPSG